MATPAQAAGIDADSLTEHWQEIQREEPLAALGVWEKLPVAVRARIGPEAPLDAFLVLGPDRYATTILYLDGEARTRAEEHILEAWAKEPQRWLYRALPEDIARRLPGDLVREAWRKVQHSSVADVVHLLTRMTEALTRHLPVGEVERLLLDSGLEAFEEGLFRELARLPERFLTERVTTAALRAFDALRGAPPSVVMASLHLIHRTAPALRARLSAEEVKRHWQWLRRNHPSAALVLLSTLPAQHLPDLTPPDVRSLWEGASQSQDPKDLVALSHVPGALRPWLDRELMQGIVEEIGPDRAPGFDDLEGMAPDVQALLGREDLRMLLFSASGAAAWLAWQERRLAEGQTLWPALVQEAFLSFGTAQAERAMHWLAAQREEMRRLISQEVRAEVWRIWLGADSTDPRSTRWADALKWAGVDADHYRLPASPDILSAPEELRPAALEAEVRRAVLDGVRHSPQDGLALLDHLPAPLRAVISQGDLQAVWSELLVQDRAAEALILLEHAPAEIRPVPSAEDFTRLLQSPRAPLRLKAIQLMATFPAPTAGTATTESERSSAEVQAPAPLRPSR
jgi:hypothetical protein